MKRVFGVLVAVILTLAFVLTACGKQKEEEVVSLTVSEVTHSVFYAPQYAAIALGYFEEEGLEVELINGGGADNVMTSVMTGEVEIGLAGPEASIYVYNEGKEDHTQIFAQLTKRDGSFLVSREPVENFTYDDLHGKHILSGRAGGVPYMTFEHVVKSNVGDISDIDLDTSVDFAMMGPVFTSGTGDYVVLFEPTATAVVEEGHGYIVASIGQESGEIPYTAYFANKSYIEENPDVIERFTNAIYRAQQWVDNASAREIAEVIADFFPDTDLDTLETVTQNHKDIDAWMTNPFMTEDSFNRLQDVMEEAGELKQRASYDDIVNNSFADKVTGK